jgi:hypothetical protein
VKEKQLSGALVSAARLGVIIDRLTALPGEAFEAKAAIPCGNCGADEFGRYHFNATTGTALCHDCYSAGVREAKAPQGEDHV